MIKRLFQQHLVGGITGEKLETEKKFENEKKNGEALIDGQELFSWNLMSVVSLNG